MEINSIRRIELAMFRLHPEVKPLYTVLKHISNGDIKLAKYSTKRAKANRHQKSSDFNPEILQAVKDICRFAKLKEIEAKLDANGVTVNYSISYILNQMKKEGILVNYSPSGSRKDYYWGLPIWLDSNGLPKPGYQDLSLTGRLFWSQL
ncbi:MAG: hypothetical protein H7Y13_17700 [Sphingobacteriaceae bacterium]|nr:hypothetical protein [Sphingobacteriaceae bacterium]